MLKNNIEIDVKVKCVEEQITQAELAEKTGTSPSYVNRLIKKPEKIVNNTFIKMQEKWLIRRENGKRNGRWEVLIPI
jgi:transcriptional regulator with XRE-family HTH domain